MEARQVILIASGERKAEIIKHTLRGPVTTKVPATVVRNHPNSMIMLDEAAARWVKGLTRG